MELEELSIKTGEHQYIQPIMSTVLILGLSDLL